jgi:hypothetical protein
MPGRRRINKVDIESKKRRSSHERHGGEGMKAIWHGHGMKAKIRNHRPMIGVTGLVTHGLPSFRFTGSPCWFLLTGSPCWFLLTCSSACA